VTAVVDNTGTTLYTYDDVGRLTQVTYPGDKTVGYEYDAAGNRTKLTYPDSTYITYEYDVLNRLTKIKNSGGTTLAQYSYDSLSRRLDLVYANGAQIAYDYDVAGRLLDVNNVTNSGIQDYAYAYDFVGNRTSMTVTDNAGVRVHSYTYDDIYQITDVDYPEDFDYLATDTTFNYDAVGNRTSVVDDSGTTSYTSNELNQYTAVEDVNCTYDLAGNMTYDGTNSYYYDAENRLIRVVKMPDPLSAACDTTMIFTTGGDAEWFSETSEYYYDTDAAQSGDIGDSQSSWMETTVLGAGTIHFYWKVSSGAGDYLSFSIDGQNQYSISGNVSWAQQSFSVTGLGAHKLRWTYSKDASGSENDDCGRIDYVYWTPGTRVPSTELADGLDTDLDVVTAGDSVWAKRTTPYYYGNDCAGAGGIYDGELTQMEVWVEGEGSVSFYWKVSSEQNCDWLEFYIDGVRQDRISGEVDWTQKSYNLSGTGTHSLLWQYVKDYGSEEGSDSGWVDYLQWTPSGSGATQWEEVEYVYDPSGRRIAKVFDDVTTVKYVYDGDNIIAEYDGEDTLVRKFIHGPGIDEPIAMIDVEDGSTPYYYHYDGLGSVVALTDASGDTVEVYEYSVFGQVASSDANNPNPFMFTGREFDKETGLYFYRARYYNPTVGRFLQTDPVGQGMNWYAYCGNNSANCVDPSGMIGHFLDSENGLLRYEAEDGTITTFEGEDALQEWMNWYGSDLKSRGILASQLVGYKMAGGDIELLMTLQAMIALGYDAEKIRVAEADRADGTMGARIQLIDDSYQDRYEWDQWHRTVYWGNHNDNDNTPAMVWLAHEVEHAWQDATTGMGYFDINGQWVGADSGVHNAATAKVEEGAMIAANDMGLAFYKKVPGYGKGGIHETHGPFLTYSHDGTSLLTGEVIPAPHSMTWEEYEERRGFICVY
jgi:RHS repeat-associated protein